MTGFCKKNIFAFFTVVICIYNLLQLIMILVIFHLFVFFSCLVKYKLIFVIKLRIIFATLKWLYQVRKCGCRSANPKHTWNYIERYKTDKCTFIDSSKLSPVSSNDWYDINFIEIKNEITFYIWSIIFIAVLLFSFS